jgi:Rrf2 family protein
MTKTERAHAEGVLLAMLSISARTEYACIAVLELARHADEPRPVRAALIADRHGIPPQFLVQIFQQLKSAGLVQSTRGAAGGYRLLLPAADISLLDVMRVVDPQPEEIVSSASQRSSMTDVLISNWQDVSSSEAEQLSAISFADLLAEAGNATEPMYYI